VGWAPTDKQKRFTLLQFHGERIEGYFKSLLVAWSLLNSINWIIQIPPLTLHLSHYFLCRITKTKTIKAPCRYKPITLPSINPVWSMRSLIWSDKFYSSRTFVFIGSVSAFLSCDMPSLGSLALRLCHLVECLCVWREGLRDGEISLRYFDEAGTK
jgi:hypothetical protein